MTRLQTPRDRAVALILALAIAIALALTPFLSGLLGAAVLHVMFADAYRRLERGLKPGLAASIILVTALALIALPVTWLIGLVIDQAPDALRSIQGSNVFARVGELRVGTFQVGAEIAKASGTLVSWLSSQLISFAGGAASAALNIIIAFFGLYYLLRSGPQIWSATRSYIPFSAPTADALAERFVGVTRATLLGTALVGVTQGTVIGVGFAVAGLPNPLFWGAVTAFASVLPVLGSGLVWLPAVLILLAQGRYGGAIVLLVIGAGVASNVDNVIRPLVYKRVSNIHPMITLVGAFAGVRYFGLLGILLGPLAIAYLFELLRFYREEYGDAPQEVIVVG
jgi:predicted PurR-regulated permease PerM